MQLFTTQAPATFALASADSPEDQAGPLLSALPGYYPICDVSHHVCSL